MIRSWLALAAGLLALVIGQTQGVTIGLDYLDADRTTYAVTEFDAQWDGGSWVSIGLPSAEHLADTVSGASTYVVAAPFSSGTHTVRFRAVNVVGPGPDGGMLTFVVGGGGIVPGALPSNPRLVPRQELQTMAVAFGGTKSTAPATGSTVTSANWTISGSDLVILLEIGMNNASGSTTVQSVSWSLGSGTAVEVKTLENVQGADRCRVSIWAIPAPVAGTGTFTVTLNASRPYQISADYFTGADQTTPAPLGDAVSTSGATNPLSLTPTNLAAGDAAVGMGANANAGDAPRFQQSETYFDNTTTINAATGYHLGTGAVSVLWGTADVRDTMVAVRVVASAATIPVFFSRQVR